MNAPARWIWTLALVGLLLAAGRANAHPIVFNGPGGFGISAVDAAEAAADGVPIIPVASISTAAALHLTIPAPDVMSFTPSGNPSVSNPNRATSEWKVTNAGAGDLHDLWLVFFNPVTYTPSQVGFEIDGDAGWALFTVDVSGTDYFYPARFLGDLGASELEAFIMHHLVGEAMHTQGAKLLLPQYSVGALQGIPVPEPAGLALSGAALALAALLRRRSA